MLNRSATLPDKDSDERAALLRRSREERYRIPVETVVRLQDGERAALRFVHDRLAGRFFAICRRILADDQLAEDALQNTFILIWKRRASLRAPEAFVAWSSRIAANSALQILRRQREELDIDAPDAPEPADSAPPSAAGERLDLERAVSRLSRRRRAVLVLHDIEGYRHREIGEMLGISEGTSKAHLFHAREAIKKYLEQ